MGVNSMLEFILLISIVFLILVFFYKQAICEFRINQIEWLQKSQIPKLLSEKLPLVVRSIPSNTFWTRNTKQYDSIPIFNEMPLSQWLSNGTTNVSSTIVCPWRYTQAERIASASGIVTWAHKWLNPSVLSYQRFWTLPRYHCWAGNIGLRKLVAWTCLFVTEGEIQVTIMPETVEQALPAVWLNRFPTEFTERDTPLLADLKYIDIILRPGNALFMPPHWFMCYRSNDGLAMTCTISYHTPISYLAFHTSPYIQH
jgi:hypothetical protein